MKQNPKVSVCMITYSHENYIREAIEGVLMQECNFEVELILANDCSPDKTDEVIQDILKNHPKASWIKYLKHDKNIGMMPNFIFSMKQCSGDYIALCEGDDYWTDPLKLQKQVDFLEVNHECNICFHRANLLSNKGLTLHQIPSPYENLPFFYVQLLKHYNFITTASIVFRKPENFIFPKWFEILPFGDLGLYKLVSNGKEIACINEVMSVYRIHENGVFSGISQFKAEKNYLDFYINIFFHLDKAQKKVVSGKMRKVLARISKKYSKNTILNKLYYNFNLLKFYKYL